MPGKKINFRGWRPKRSLSARSLSATKLFLAFVSVPSFILMIGITLLEILVAAIQAYVFALLTSLYLNDAINLH